MGGINDEMKQAFVDESLEHLSSMETDLLLIEEGGVDIDESVVNKVFRTAHSIKGGAGFLGLTRLKELSHEMETVLGHVRSRNLVPNAEIIHFLLLASDTLEELIHNMDDSDHIEISHHLEALRLLSHGAGQVEKGGADANTPGFLGNGETVEFDTGRDTVKEHRTSPKKDLPADLPAREALPGMEDAPQEIAVCGGDGEVVFVLPLQDLARAGDEHKGVFFIEIPLKDHKADHKNTTAIIEKEIKAYGTVLDSCLDPDYLSMAGEGEQGPFFLVLFASILAVDELVVLFEVDGKSILELDGDIPGDAMGVESKRYESRMQGGTGDNEILVDDPFRESIPTLENTDIPRDDGHDSYSDKASLAGGQNYLRDVDVDPVLASVYEPQVRVTPAHDRATPSTSTEKKGWVSEASIRVDLTLLDTLMTLAGELVLSRNQLLQAIGANDTHATEIVGQRINLITSELQETVMLTRMQPMGKIFDRFPRLVRDLSATLGKKVKLTIKGREVELDKTLLEAISDPLIHLIRNGVDHGIESSDVRESRGKSDVGQIFLKAFHEAGKVNIEIADDGRGLDGNVLVDRAVSQGFLTTEQAGNLSSKEKLNLIFMPGFSTAAEVTDLSGRGVGLDVVKSNVDSVGGQVKIESQPGIGTRFLIKVPLTLAIIPSQIVLAEQERFAIPQLNLEELVRVPGDQVYEKIEYVGNGQVVRLRDELLPLVRLADVIGVERTYYCHKTGQRTKDHRLKIADRRSSKNPFVNFMEKTDALTTPAKGPLKETEAERRDACWTDTDRRYHASSALNITVVSTGTMKYGLIVDALHDSEEIVVKPLGRHLQKCRAYAGATIMGDGRVTLILDVANIADMAGILPVEVPGKRPADEASSDEKSEEHMVQSLLTFRGAPHEPFAVPLNQVVRIEKVASSHMETLGQMRVVQNRGKTLPLFAVDEVADVAPIEFGDTFLVIVFEVGGREVGLLAAGPVDAVDTHESIDEITLRQPGILGSVPIHGHTTMVVDINEIVKQTSPPQAETIEAVAVPPGDVEKQGEMILVVEDSGFFRNQIKAYIEEVGYQVITAEDGQVALDLIASHARELSLVVTDLEMPHVDGFTLTRTIKETSQYAHLPVIALSTLADDADLAKGDAAGVDDYQIKLDRDALLKSIETHILRIKKEPR
ncbi:MAG: chemotaxis protein CheW [Desulfobacterium sp.]